MDSGLSCRENLLYSFKAALRAAAPLRVSSLRCGPLRGEASVSLMHYRCAT